MFLKKNVSLINLEKKTDSILTLPLTLSRIRSQPEASSLGISKSSDELKFSDWN